MTDEITVLVSWEHGAFRLALQNWAQLPLPGDWIRHPDAIFNIGDDRSWEVRRRVYWPAKSESDEKIKIQEIEVLCELDDPQNLGLTPFFCQDPNPFPRPLNIPLEYREAILTEIQKLAGEALEKNDWSDLFIFLTVRLPKWKGSTGAETDEAK